MWKNIIKGKNTLFLSMIVSAVTKQCKASKLIAITILKTYHIKLPYFSYDPKENAAKLMYESHQNRALLKVVL